MRGVVVLLVLLAGGCIVDRNVRPGDKLDPRSAYLYGRFFVTSKPPAWASGSKLWFDLHCADHQKYLFKVNSTMDVQVVAVRPARCKITTLYGTRNGATVFTDPVMGVPEVEFAAGHAYYVGNLLVWLEESQALTEPETAQWARHVEEVNDPYGTATAEMKRAFPNLASLPTEDRSPPAAAR